ncbi:MAG: hypothetical protein ABIM89_05320 [Mycobacteriales bacterium]
MNDDDRPTPETEPDEVRDVPTTSTNQARTEPVPPSPAATPPDFAAQSADRKQPDASEVALARAEPPVPSPGNINDEHGHVAVSTLAAAGTSEQQGHVEGVKTTALAQPGKPDGEVAT